MKTVLIAPCGMNCAICVGYLREKNKCSGCRDIASKFVTAKCIIARCDFFKKSKHKYCIYCEKFPCRRLKQLDKRYRTRYGMSMINNLKYIKKNGIRAFVRKEEKRWVSKRGVKCVHNKKYYEVS